MDTGGKGRKEEHAERKEEGGRRQQEGGRNNNKNLLVLTIQPFSTLTLTASTLVLQAVFVGHMSTSNHASHS